MWENLRHFTKIGRTKPADSEPMFHGVINFQSQENVILETSLKVMTKSMYYSFPTNCISLLSF